MDTDVDTQLVGRDLEIADLDALIARAVAGESAARVVVGAPGIGKSALLRHTASVAAARGLRVLTARGYEGEADLPYASLFELVQPVLDLRGELPPVQAHALGVALALEGSSGPPERFAVPASLLSLLSLAASGAPVLAVIDDLHWVDSASREALLFAARRLGQDGVGMLFACRDETGVIAELGGVPRTDLAPLDENEAVALLTETADMPRSVAAALAARTAGNPLALLEVPRLLTEAQRAGAEPLGDVLPLDESLERVFGRRMEALDDEARQALTVAAMLDGGDLPALHRALAELGLPPDALSAAERARLLTLRDGQVAFWHPLARSAAQHLAADADRRAAHAAVAAASEDPRLRAWHLALSAVQPDESVAAELEAVGWESRERGGHAAAARALSRAATLTPDRGRAGVRRLDGASAWIDAGHLDRALTLLDAIDLAVPGGPDPAAVARVRAQVQMRRGEPLEARELLVADAERVAATAPAVAAQAMLEAAIAHMMTGDMAALVADGLRARDLAVTAGAEPLEAMAEVVIGETYLAMGRSAEGDELLARREGFLLSGDPLAIGAEIFGMAGHSSYWIERWDRAEAVLDRIVTAAREANGFGKLVYPLAARAQMDFRRGAWVRGLADADEAVQLAEATGQTVISAHALAVLAEIEAGIGHTRDAQAHGAESLRITEEFGLAAIRPYALRALGLDHLAHGRVDAALEVLGEATGMTEVLELGSAGLVMFLPDHVEALVRARRPDEAVEVLEIFRRRAHTGGTWAPAAVARCEGLLAPADDFDAPFERALALHAEGHQPFEHGRTALLYGERLRRSRQRARARDPLRTALDLFAALGAEPWTARVESELIAAGGAPAAERERSPSELLTPGELQVALMVARGLRNREVAASLFLSEKTVERHLTSTYRKLDLRSRAELAAAFAGDLAATS